MYIPRPARLQSLWKAGSYPLYPANSKSMLSMEDRKVSSMQSGSMSVSPILPDCLSKLLYVIYDSLSALWLFVLKVLLCTVSLSVALSLFQSTCLFPCLSLCIYTSLFFWMCVSLLVWLFVCMSDWMSACLSVRTCVYLTVCLSVFLSACLSVVFSVCIFVFLSVVLSACLYVFLSACPSVVLSACLSVVLSACHSLSPSFREDYISVNEIEWGDLKGGMGVGGRVGGGGAVVYHNLAQQQSKTRCWPTANPDVLLASYYLRWAEVKQIIDSSIFHRYC